MKKHYWISIIGVLGLLVAFGLGATIRLPLNTEAKEDRPTQKPLLDTSLQTTPSGCWEPAKGEQVCAEAIWRFTGHKEHSAVVIVSGTYKVNWENRSTRQWAVRFELKFYDKYGFEISSFPPPNTNNFPRDIDKDFQFKINPNSQQTKAKGFYLRLSNLEEASSISEMKIFGRVYSPKWDR